MNEVLDANEKFKEKLRRYSKEMKTLEDKISREVDIRIYEKNHSEKGGSK